jgi:hypothetical protein
LDVPAHSASVPDEHNLIIQGGIYPSKSTIGLGLDKKQVALLLVRKPYFMVVLRL